VRAEDVCEAEMGFVEGETRGQWSLLPAGLEDYVAA
jgi:hypothetical protein